MTTKAIQKNDRCRSCTQSEDENKVGVVICRSVIPIVDIDIDKKFDDTIKDMG